MPGTDTPLRAEIVSAGSRRTRSARALKEVESGGPGDGRGPREADVPIRVGVLEEHEIHRAGLVALLVEEPGFEVMAVSPEQPALREFDVAVVSGSAARRSGHSCPIIVCTDDFETPEGSFAGNNVAGVLHRPSTTASQLRATVHAVAAGLHVEAPHAGERDMRLDPRAVRLLELMADGRSTREIATAMSYSERTIKKLITQVEERLGTRTRAQTVAQAIRHGLI
jgi:DNA-binding NarL/FixJ family response regulator